MDVFKLTPQGGLSRLVQHIESIFDGGCKEVYISLIGKEQAKTQAQNKTFHKLLSMWHKSGMASIDDHDRLRNYYKLKAGIIDQYLYIDGEQICTADKPEDIPKHVPKSQWRVIAGSWSRATKGQAIAAIDMVIEDMHKSGYSSKEFDQMLEHFREWR